MKIIYLTCLSLFLLFALHVDARIIETQCPNCGKYYLVGSHHRCAPKLP